MAAPVALARSTPAGLMLRDGYSSKITFTADPDVSFWEKVVQPAGLDGGDSIDQTTMHNVDYRTMFPRALITLTETTVTAAYDPNVINNVIALINVPTTITITFPDGSTYAYFGYLKTIEFAELTEGEQPELTVTMVPTNMDSSYVEQAPVLTSVTGS